MNKWKYEYAYKSNDNLDNVGDNDKSYLIKEVDISNHGDADEEVPKVSREFINIKQSFLQISSRQIDKQI